jgi:hypothetical protein
VIHMSKRQRDYSRRVVHLSDVGMTSLQLVTLFPEATYNAVRGAYRVGKTLFVCPPFSLSDDADDEATQVLRVTV